jgi:FkbM family methyltransferase
VKLEESIIQLCPESLRLPFRYHYSRVRGRLEKEIFYLEQLVGDGKRAIDIGANKGIYSYALSQVCDIVEVFEPQCWCTEGIVAYSKAYRRKINVHNVGLSNLNGALTLHLPISNNDYSSWVPGLGNVVTGLGSFRELEGEQTLVNVPVRQLDDYKFTDVSFIKIDVEGHESRVIAGGSQTLVREKPVILIEIEQRHLGEQSIDEIFEQISELGYEGSFLYKHRMIPLSEFSYQVNQKPFLDNVFSEEYIKNFIFKPLMVQQNC